jgi:Xaa-Pro aminopeptidase
VSTTRPGGGPGDDPAAIAAALARRREATQREWDLSGATVVIGAGEPIPIPGRGDLVYPFHSHSEYLYLTDSERPGGVLAFDPDEGWIEFVRPISIDERLWEGASDISPVHPGRSVDELGPWLQTRRERRLAILGAPVPGVLPDPQLAHQLRRSLNRVRRPKDEVELDRMRTAERATRAGFATAARLIAPGISERALQVELEAEFRRHGADRLAFDTIIASGPNSAVLHFPPTARLLAERELVLIDAGAQYRGYASDVTRTFSVSGELSPPQAAIYELVRAALEEGVELCTPGMPWRDVHLAAARVIGEGLIDLGLLRGAPEDVVEQGAVAAFFPHGLGHLVGLGVRDAGDRLPEFESEDGGPTPALRTNVPLETGFVTTVEPGVYFVPALLGDPEVRRRLSSTVDWERVEKMIGFGGIRLEHNVLVTDSGPEVLTADIPLL